VVSCEQRKCKKKVFPAAIREKSLRGVALFCDAHVMSTSSGKIRQPCTVSLGDQVLSETFFSSQHFCAGNSTVLRCMTVAPLGMFLLAYLFDTYLLIFEGHTSWSQSLGNCCMVCSRYYWVCRPGKICNVCFFRLHWFGKCSASTGLNSFSCLSQQGQDLRMNISSARMHFCVAILFQVQCRLFTHAVLFACDTFFVCKIARRVLRC